MQNLLTKQINSKLPAANSRFAKAGASCFCDREVLNSRFMRLMKFLVLKIPAFAKGHNVSDNKGK